MLENYWSGKKAVVCGATAGLGRACAIALAGCHVGELSLIARSEAGLFALRDELRESAANTLVRCLVADMSDAASLQKAIDALPADAWPVDLLIQAVGKSDRGRLSELPVDRLQELIAANVLSNLHALQLMGPLMRSPGGRLVMIGSLAGRFAPRFLGGYAIAKHALVGLAQQARLELAEQGIGLTLVSPGPIARPDAGRRYDEQARTEGLPAEARQPGGGAKLRGLEAEQLAADILAAAAAGKAEIMRPRRARLLLILSAIAPAWGDRLLRKRSS